MEVVLRYMRDKKKVLEATAPKIFYQAPSHPRFKQGACVNNEFIKNRK